MYQYFSLITAMVFVILQIGCDKKDAPSSSPAAESNNEVEDSGQSGQVEADNSGGPADEDDIDDLNKNTSSDVGAVTGSLALDFAAAGGGSSLGLTSGGFNLLDSGLVFENSFIASGPADGFEIYITKLTLLPKGDSGEESLMFEKSEGVKLVVEGSSIDLSALLTAAGASGDKLELSVSVGTYEAIEVEFLRYSRVKGCVQGYFLNGAVSDGTHIYCTRSDYSTFTTGDSLDWDNTPFEVANASSKDPEWMDFDLVPGENGTTPYFTTDKTETFKLKFSTGVDIVIEENKSKSLTMLFDFARVLRFNNNHNTTRGTSPMADDAGLTNVSHFFSSVFSSSIMVFVGDAGTIYGYEVIAEACNHGSDSSGWDADNRTCNLSSNLRHIVVY